MKNIAIAFMVLVWTSSCISAGSTDGISLELIKMATIDQDIRNRMLPLLASTDFTQPPTVEFQALVNEQNEIDARNAQRLVEIVVEIGWPTSGRVGLEASEATQLLIQHFGLEHQKQLVPYLLAAVNAGEAGASSLAMLEDDILVKEGKEQLYGTEIVTGPDGQFALYAVQDPKKLNERRLAVGLPPIEVYIQFAELSLGSAIDISTLTRERP